ncbi:MAG: hypothetical protein WAS21_12405 [Geminicoccaceae bacterium]
MRLHDTIGDGSIILPTALRRRLEQPRFDAAMFTPTRFATAAEKADFARHFVRFLAEGMPSAQFTKKFYNRLSSTFGHIAHFSQLGFYEHFFADLAGKVRFLEQTLEWWPVGDPAWTFRDVERELQERIHAARILPLYQSLLQGNRPTSANPARAPSGAQRPASIPVARPPQADLFDLG